MKHRTWKKPDICFKTCIYLKDSVGETERNRNLPSDWFTLATIASAGSKSSLEPETPSTSPTRMAGTQACGPFSALVQMH